MNIYGDKVSDKIKAKIDIAMQGLNEAIPSEDAKEIGDAVRALEKQNKKVDDQILSFTSEKEIEERQAKVEEEMKKA